MRLLIATVLWVFLAGCAVTYSPAPFWGASGYSSKDINANTVSVNFLTGRTVNIETARIYALYRCAEITLEKRYDWFLIKEGSARNQTGGYGAHASATYVIEMFRGTPPLTQQHVRNEQIYVARTLMAQLEPKIVREGRTLKNTESSSDVVGSESSKSGEPVLGSSDRFVVTDNRLAVKVAIDDVNSVPMLDDRGKQGYRDWLGKPMPRAFVIAEGGKWNSTWGTNPRNSEDPKDPTQRAMVQCQRRGLKSCRLYAVDDRVVWTSE